MSARARFEIERSRHRPGAAAWLIASLAALAAPAGAAVEWRTDVEAALAESQASGRPLVLDFWAVWCAPCQTMDRTVWAREDVTARAAEFTMVRVDVDRLRSWTSRYHVAAFPTVLVTDSWGNGLARRIGAVDAQEILDLFAHVPRDFRPIDRWNATLAENPEHGDALLAVGRFYEEGKLADVAVAYFEKAAESERAKHDPQFLAAVRVAIGWNQLALREFKLAEKALERALKGAPAPREREAALFGLVVAALGRDQRRQAEKRLAELRTAFPASEAATKAAQLVARDD